VAAIEDAVEADIDAAEIIAGNPDRKIVDKRELNTRRLAY
jgi:hypothetical protein